MPMHIRTVRIKHSMVVRNRQENCGDKCRHHDTTSQIQNWRLIHKCCLRRIHRKLYLNSLMIQRYVSFTFWRFLLYYICIQERNEKETTHTNHQGTKKCISRFLSLSVSLAFLLHLLLLLLLSKKRYDSQHYKVNEIFFDVHLFLDRLDNEFEMSGKSLDD